jgi:hypothetical protein
MTNDELIKYLAILPKDDEVQFEFNPHILDECAISYGLEIIEGKLYMSGCTIDHKKARERFLKKHNMTPEQFYEENSQDCSGEKLRAYYEASFLINTKMSCI